MAVTACLYNLSHDTAPRLHPHILREIVAADLDAMETFPQHQQLQKNILLTICCDRIMNDVTFDRFRCARLAMNCLCEWQDNSMNKMSVAICSMLGKSFLLYLLPASEALRVYFLLCCSCSCSCCCSC
jgi:Zyg-11 family protein